MPIEISEVRKRLLQTIDQARQLAADRRTRVKIAGDHYERFLEEVAGPVFRMVATVLKTEGYNFQVFTPAAGVRLVSDRSEDGFIELTLDVTQEPAIVIGRISRQWGSKIMTTDRVVKEGTSIENLIDKHVLDFLLKELQPFVER